VTRPGGQGAELVGMFRKAFADKLGERVDDCWGRATTWLCRALWAKGRLGEGGDDRQRERPVQSSVGAEAHTNQQCCGVMSLIADGARWE